MATTYFYRKVDDALLAWEKQKIRKPVLLRGARQVGKTSAVRKLATHFDYYIEINFEEQKQVQKLFAGDLTPSVICENLSVLFNTPVKAGKTLLFFDEIQACIPAISSLRFFYEKCPDLHVIAAGSLLEFALDELPSFGLGRVRTMFMYPFSFDEFLAACGEEKLLITKQKAVNEPLPEPIHLKLLDYLRRFLILGGMPEVVAEYATTKNFPACQSILDDLIIPLKADFVKYKNRVPASRISEVFNSVIQQSGGKFVLSKAATETGSRQIKEALELLIKAGLVMPVTHTSANGLPLGAESDLKKRKILVFDTGIFQRIIGLNISDVLLADDIDVINKGSLAEIFAGLEILKAASCYNPQELFYWQREALNSTAEVDYIIKDGTQIIPVEVKSGKKGSMRSMYLFLEAKKRKKGYRFSLESFSHYDKIYSFPLYSVSDVVKEA